MYIRYDLVNIKTKNIMETKHFKILRTGLVTFCCIAFVQVVSAQCGTVRSVSQPKEKKNNCLIKLPKSKTISDNEAQKKNQGVNIEKVDTDEELIELSKKNLVTEAPIGLYKWEDSNNKQIQESEIIGTNKNEKLVNPIIDQNPK